MSTEIVVRTACPAHCPGNACGILAHVRDGQVTKLEPAPFPDSHYTRICQKGLTTLQILYHSDCQSQVSQLIARRSGYILKPEETTGPAVYYLPLLSQRPV